MKKAVLVIGQSHVGAIRLAARARAETHPDRPRVRAIHTLEKRYAPFYVGDGEDAAFAPPLADAIAEQIAWHRPVVVSVNGGNVHNVLSLVRHPRPFDFLLSSEDGPPLDPDAEPISEALVRAALDHGLVGDRFLLRLTKAAANAAFHLESPPPLADNRTIEDYAAAHFEGMPAFGAASPGLRYKIWRLHSRIVAGYCADLGITFLPVPREVQDANGFLLPHLAGDATHGNQAYGDIIVRMLEEL
jgi:hypothetical protein